MVQVVKLKTPRQPFGVMASSLSKLHTHARYSSLLVLVTSSLSSTECEIGPVHC